MKRQRWLSGMLFGGVMLLVWMVCGVAVATAQGLTGCLTKGGSLTNVAIGDAPSRRCLDDQVAVHLGSPMTCPEGTTYFIGVCIENTARTAQNYFDATDSCTEMGHRLPLAGELKAFRELDGIVIGAPAEWTDDLALSRNTDSRPRGERRAEIES
jgi:hypothetical protein